MKLFTVWDILLAATLILGGIVSIPFIRSHKADTVTVYDDNRIIATYPISENRTFPIKSRNGPMTIEISNGTVSVHSSTCKRQICVDTAPIKHAGEQIICVPNHIIIQISSEKNNGQFDAVAQ